MEDEIRICAVVKRLSDGATAVINEIVTVRDGRWLWSAHEHGEPFVRICSDSDYSARLIVAALGYADEIEATG